MRTKLPEYLVCLLAAVAMAGACGDDDGNDDNDGDGGDTETDWSCLEQACVNVDHNTHTDCGCAADYCYPSIGGASHSNLEELTCTKKDCKIGDSSSCPPDYECMAIPASIINMAKDEYGAILPATVCGKKE